ncbi:ATP-binding protein [Niabella sp. CJ426]|uniref:ATP-binding protein n=1 Tax=Niabella sp. CJ426 TaxID=3393740 RepID=UPI003D040501
MDDILNKSMRLVRKVQTGSIRYLFDKILWNNRLIGIKGARGMGKTTMLLQKIKALQLPPHQATYWTLDDLFFTNASLVDTAVQFYNKGGRYLFLDEVHKYPGWSQHIKNLYDLYDDLKIVLPVLL